MLKKHKIKILMSSSKPAFFNTVTSWDAWLIRRGLDWMIGFISPYTFTHLENTRTGNTTLSLFHVRCTRTRILSSLVVSWQRISNSLTSTHTWHSLIPFLPFILNHLPLPPPELDAILILAAWNPCYIASERTKRKTPSSIVKECVYSSVA
jgi:hypothetical protein